MNIRDAVEDDFGTIAAIYNEVLLNSTAIYRDQPVDVAERVAAWKAVKNRTIRRSLPAKAKA